ncbi:hypothetical protein ACH42_03690 [Endozoicomonas sp. (ex Bugula neritina AB1)]|nr:hypothetical protein ACH42_03690 [Endozoicomonas sp. (ex Bugula neritina AB1)]
MESIHGRNVLNLIEEQDQAVSKDELLTAINHHFGAEGRFHTCSADNMTSEQLITMFLQKGKLEEVDNLIQFRGCNCGGH